MSQANQTERSVPNVAPNWEELYERSEYDATVRKDPSGGVVVHRCHPNGEPEDFFAFASRHETMKGYVDKDVILFRGPADNERTGCGIWNSAVASFHFREGSHEDCAVCQGDADPRELLQEVVDVATEQVGGEHNVAKTGIYEWGESPSNSVVYLDSHGQGASGSKPAGDSENRPSMASSGSYSVNNSTRHWQDRINKHPYVWFAGAEEVGESGNAHSPDNTLKVTLRTWYPDVVPEVRL